MNALSPLAMGLFGWVALLSVIATALTVYDKWAAVHRPRHRVRESVLMWTGALGGAGVMFLMMKAIRHKTLHRKFMIGLPMLFLLQTAAAGALLWYLG